jgi:general secretion pathway protein H
MKLSTGFTLMEMLVGLAILTLALTLVPPLFTNVITSTQIKSATRILAASLKQVRSEAISKQTETTLTLDVESQQFAVGVKLRSLDLPKDTRLTLIAADTEQLSAQQAAIRFFPDGSSTGGRIELSHLRNQYRIDVNWLTGTITISP